jgi:hypothetical protein
MSNVDPSLVLSITHCLNDVQALISSACHEANRAPSSVALLAVTKTHTAQVVAAAYAAGLRDFGENYVQEGADKIVALQQLMGINDARWHFIGPLQSNKTRIIAEHFDWMHSVDRLKIAQRLSEQRPASLASLNICLQVNISDETSKSGCSVSEALELSLDISQLPRLKLRGLMAIPAPVNKEANVSEQRAPLLALTQLFERIKIALPNEVQAHFDTLSMGMSDDYTHAIHAGSTMIRIGSALFGNRNYTQ